MASEEQSSRLHTPPWQESHSRPPTFALPLRPRADPMALCLSTEALSRTTLPSPNISIEFHGDNLQSRPSLEPPRSAPADMQHFKSPLRHHRRTPSAHREVKETLNARSEYGNDDSSPGHHRVNQYVIKEEIGRGSYGAVHLATDQFGNEYAVKEFSKARLRKRAQSSLLRHGPRRLGRLPSRAGFGAPDAPIPINQLSNHKAEEAKDALFLIREEIAIMKKLNHPNLVQLIEVLDDPEEDSLYMVLEMCKKGVVMKVGLQQTATPYPEESCRCWFRDLILGIEYLHSQGVVHRDIKPDNLLLTRDDVLKVVDFGVSEMFERADDMRTAKSAGSPAFLPPELCVARHGDVSGKAADVWSMGVSLYCLRYGRIPFERDGVLDMYDAIKTETPKFPPDENEQFVDVMSRLMEKDPEQRITMAKLRGHPWVTRGGEDPLLSADENCTDPVDLPNALEVNHAFTRRMSHLLCVMKAISKFKSLLTPKEGAAETPPPQPQEAAPAKDKFDGKDQKEEKKESDEETTPRASTSAPEKKDEPSEGSTAEHAARVLKEREQFRKATGDKTIANLVVKVPDSVTDGDTAAAAERTLLGIGTGGIDDFGAEPLPADVVSDSPTAVDFNIYERAFEAEVDRIKRSTSRRRGPGTVYFNRFKERGSYGSGSGTGTDENLASAVRGDGGESSMSATAMSVTAMSVAQRGGTSRFAALVAQAVMDAKTTAASQDQT